MHPIHHAVYMSQILRSQRPKRMALLAPFDTKGGNGLKHAEQLGRLSEAHLS